MRKEVIIAIAFGLVVGLVITIGMYRARTALEETPTETTAALVEDSLSPLPSSAPQTQNGLILREPVEEAVTTTPNIRVSGSTFANRAIVLLINEKEVVAMSDDQGNFSIPVTVTIGGNILKVRVLNPGEAASEVTRTVIYELPLAALASESGTPATAAGTIRR